VIDLHCHVLPGIDDGPATIEDSLALARAAVAAGTHTIVATPHVSWHYPNDPEKIVRLTAELNNRLSAEGIELEVQAGAEIAMTRAGEVQGELESLSLGGGSWVLLEPPFSPLATGLEGVVAELRSAGRQVVIAHPERCPAFHRDPAALASLVRAGALSSITAGSLVGRFGGEVRRFARRLVAEGLAHNVASDAHDALKRPPGMSDELREAGLGELSDWLTSAVPGAILNGEEIPPRPVAVSRQGRFRGIRRRRR
jgi:protein-tyrosine phosphatase